MDIIMGDFDLDLDRETLTQFPQSGREDAGINLLDISKGIIASLGFYQPAKPTPNAKSSKPESQVHPTLISPQSTIKTPPPRSDSLLVQPTAVDQVWVPPDDLRTNQLKAAVRLKLW